MISNGDIYNYGNTVYIVLTQSTMLGLTIVRRSLRSECLIRSDFWLASIDNFKIQLDIYKSSPEIKIYG